MTRYLCVSITFLDPLFHGKGDGDVSEWPPSPMRLFQALLAGSRAGCRNSRWSVDELDSLRAAFLWLERQKPPVILAPESEIVSAYSLAVPNNDRDQESDRQERLTTKGFRPRRLSIQDCESRHMAAVHYLWGIPEEDWPAVYRHAEVLCGEAKHIMALGWGIDQVVGYGKILKDTEVDLLAGERWEPWPNDRSGNHKLRVPKKGSLRALEEVYELFLTRLGGATPNPRLSHKGFDTVKYVGSASFPYRPYAAFELTEGTSFRQEATIKVAAMLRSLACRSENQRDFREQFGDGTEVYLAGHVNGEKHTPPRFSYLPLPTIGHPNSDGMIRRLLIAEPYGGDGFRAGWAQSRLEGQVLRDIDRNERGRLLEISGRRSDNMVSRYGGESRNWSTVTPVILPGYDDGKLAKAEKLLLQAIEQAGLSISSISDLTLRKAPFWPRSQHPKHYQRPSYLRHLPGWHVELTFQEPTLGPLSLGAGRHIGLGLMANSEG